MDRAVDAPCGPSLSRDRPSARTVRARQLADPLSASAHASQSAVHVHGPGLSSTVAVAAVDDVHLKTQVDGMALIATFLEQAQTVQDGGSVSDAQIDAVSAHWVDAPRD